MKLNTLLLALATASTLTACSVKASGGGGDTAPTAKPFNNDVQGPVVDGQWTSACELDRFGQGSHILQLTIKGQSVHWNDAHFGDDSCQQSASIDTADGLMRYVKVAHDNVYDVEFKLRYPKYAFQFSRTLSLNADGQLWLSDFENADPTLALKPATP